MVPCAVEYAERGACGRAGHLSSSARVDCRVESGRGHRRLRDLEPGRHTLVGAMHGAAGIARYELPERAREVARIGGATVLIVHDLQLRSLAREAQDGGDEVRPTLAEQPLRANDQVRLGQDVPDGLLPRELAPAVHIE